MNISRVLEKLKKLGLTGYESSAYLSLLRLGDAEADEIANDAKIPMGRIYNVLSNLEEARLIRAQDTRPRKYACVEPASALERLSKSRHEELTRASVELEKLVSDLKSELSGVEPRKPDKTFWTVAIGEESHELIRECITGSQKELLVFMAPKMNSERLKKDLMKECHAGTLKAIHEAVKRGVVINIILNNDVDFSLLEEYPVVKQLLEYLGDKFNCRFAAIPATPFDITDSENVLLQMLNPINPEELFAVVNIRDTKLAKELRKKFFEIWEKAEPYTGKKNCIKKNCIKKLLARGGGR